MAKVPENLSPLTRAAILLVSLDTEAASRVLTHLDHDQVERVSTPYL